MGNFFKTNIGKAVKTAGYLALSAVISYFVTATTNDPQLFGPVTAVVNVILVLLKTTLDDTTPNLGSK